MRAWTIAPGSPGRLELDEVPDPDPADHEVLVEVKAFAPNPGDLAAVQSAPPGSVPGWDGAGRVVRAAADGSGPPLGARVLFLGNSGGWAELRALPVPTVAAAPEEVPATQLAALPVPGTSALRAVRRLGSLVGRRLLVMGANSAVGSAAVQIGARAGAEVVAVARNRETHAGLLRRGAAEVRAEVREVSGRVHGAIDVVGGPSLVAAYGILAAGGTVVALGHSAGEGEHFPLGAFTADHGAHDRAITSFFLGSEPGLDVEMTWLAREVHAGRLETGLRDVHPWTDLPGWVADGAPRSHGRVVFAVS